MSDINTSKLNIYSKTILDYLHTLSNNLDISLKEHINITHPILNELNKHIDFVFSDDINNLIVNEIKKSKKIFIKKLHSSQQDSLIYILFKKCIKYKEIKELIESQINNKINDFTSHQDFHNWYRNVQHMINFEDIMKITHKHNITELIEIFSILLVSDNPRDILHDILYFNPFVSLDNVIFSEVVDLYRIDIIYENINITVYYKTTINDCTFLHDILRIVLLYRHITEYKNEINVRILMSNRKKVFSSNRHDILLTPMNINSGSSMRGEWVNVWRGEEMEKVLMHELQHFFRFDFYILDNGYKQLEQQIYNLFNINLDRINESYNETVAGIINMLYQTKKYNLKLNKVYHYEMLYLLLQSSKILLYLNNYNMNTTYEDIYNIDIKQTTSALSYYIIKTIIFYDINNFLSLMQDFNLKCNTKEHIDKYNTYITQLIKQDNIKTHVNNILQFIKQDNKINYCLRTLRMCVLSN